MNQFLQFCVGIAVIIASTFYGYGLWKDRKNSNKLDTVKLFKDQIDGMELKMKAQELDIEKLTKEVHNLKLAIEEKDKKLLEALAILQGRDPAMSTFINSGTKFMQDNGPIFKRLEKYLDKQSY